MRSHRCLRGTSPRYQMMHVTELRRADDGGQWRDFAEFMDARARVLDADSWEVGIYRSFFRSKAR